jgi:UDP-N-acetylmuramoyl-L-alanyl-D-glutamate--2,6-diaminopimelate ligase
MGVVAGAADTIILTSDNPRSEDAGAIAGAIKRGIADRSKVTFEIDRAKAIAMAIERAGDDDVVLIAGKGHETGQTIGTVIRHFDDSEVSREALERRARR